MRFIFIFFFIYSLSENLYAAIPLDKNGYLNVSDFGALGDGITDDSDKIQAAVNQALNDNLYHGYAPPILLTGRHLISKSIVINRKVDTTRSEFRFIGNGSGAGIFVNKSMTIFDSSLAVRNVQGTSNTEIYDSTVLTSPFPPYPVSEQLTFENVQFESSSIFNDSYVISGRFLRIKFINSNFRLIKCLYSPIYAQSFFFLNSQMRNWPGNGGAGGYFFQSAGSYDVSFSSSIIENGGYFFRSTDAIRGTNGFRLINNVIEGLQGSTAVITGASGVIIMGNHIESNPANDFNFWGGSLKNNSIVIQGNYIHNPNGYEFYFGPTQAVTSIGNTGTRNLFSNKTAVTSFNSIGDVENTLGQ